MTVPPENTGAADEITYLEAIRSALEDAMRDDERVFLLGEDIGGLGRPFGATSGLLDVFGEERVLDTPIAEEGFVGAAIGAAWMGERPVVELQFADFVTCPFDVIVTVAAKTHWRSGQPIPLVIRMPTGGGVRGGPFHAGSPEGWFVGQPGLKVVCPGTVGDAYGLLRSGDRRPRSRSRLRAQGSLPPPPRPPPRAGLADAALRRRRRPHGRRRDGGDLRLGRHDRARRGRAARR